MSLVLQSSRGKSSLVNIIDTPGHVNFVDEVASAIRLADGIVLVVDVVEGVMINTEQIIKYAVSENIPMTLVLNKVDRLILELKLPPTDAYFKLKHTIEEVNTVIDSAVPGRSESLRLSPEKGNVCFASAAIGWCFSLSSFAKMYADTYAGINVSDFAKRMWGDIFYNPTSRKFSRKSLESKARRTFVHFILEPLYKLYAHVSPLWFRNPDTDGRLIPDLDDWRKRIQLKDHPRQSRDIIEARPIQTRRKSTPKTSLRAILRYLDWFRGHDCRAHSLRPRRSKGQGREYLHWAT